MRAFAPDCERVDVSGAEDAYRLLLERLWADGEAFLIVEHDVEIHRRVVPELAECPEDWCLYPYGGAGGQSLEGALGCTRFSAALIRDEPGLIGSLPVRNWRRLDCELLGKLRQTDRVPHVHQPPVLHHHIYGAGCACGLAHE